VVTSKHSPQDGDDAAGTDPADRAEKHRSPEHDRKTEQILVDADRRDEEAEIRDGVSDKRSEAADLQAFMDTNETYSGLGERRAAAVDRSHAKHDRESSADDRAELARQNDNPADPADE
jgi:hypothetical protein